MGGWRNPLVVDAYQVVGELLDSVGSRTRLDVLGVVGDEKSLLGLDDDDAFLALKILVSFTRKSSWSVHRTHLLAVQTSVIGLDDNKLLAGNVETGALDLLDVGSVLECGDNFTHLLGRNL